MLTRLHSNFSNIPGYKTLCDRVTNLSCDQSSIDNLLKTVGVKHTTDNLSAVLDNFKQIALLTPKICRDPKWHFAADHISDTALTCQTILRSRNHIKLKRLELDPEKDRNLSFQGDIGTAPFYTTLGHLPEERLYSQRYYQLLAHTLIARLLTISKNQHEKLTPLLEGSLQAIRVLAESETLKHFPQKPLSPEEYLLQLSKIQDDAHLPRIIKYLTKAFRLAQSFTLKQLGEVISKNEGGIEETDDFWSTLQSELPQDHLPEIFDEQINPHDDMKPATPGLVYAFAKPSTPNLHPQDYSYAARQAAKSRALENQLFHFSWNVFNQYDLKILFDYLFCNTNASNFEQITIRTQLGLLFFFGLTPERLADLKVFHSETYKPISDAYFSTSNSLRLYSPGPDFKTTFSTIELSQACPKHSHIDLCPPDILTPLLGEYLTRQQFSGEGSLLFTETPGQIRQASAKVLSQLARQFGSRLTLTRASRYMERRLANVLGNDLAGASLTLGKDIFLARTRVHYSGFDKDILTRFCNQAWVEIAHEADHEVLYVEPYPSRESIYLGTPIRPQLKTVQTLIETIKDFIQKRAHKVKSLQDIVDFHNAYTLYTALVIAYCSGYRAINTPYITEEMYDSTSGFCVIRDKDSPDFYHSHLTWLPVVCRKQLEHYRAHLDNIKTLSVKPIPASKSKDRDFFFLSPNGERKPATRNRIVKHLKEFGYHLPPNTQRHMLKSELQENGCPSEIIEILLGHWHIGQEGWAKTSALHPWDFKSQLEKHLPPLMQRIGLFSFAGLRHLPSTVNLRLHIKTDKELRKTRSWRRRKSKTKPFAFLTERAPGQTWFEVLGSALKNYPADKAFKDQERIVLSKILSLLPELYAGEPTDLTITNDDLTILLRRLKPKPLHPRIHFKRLNFLIDGLEWGKKNLGWVVDIPPRPVLVSKPINLVRPSLIRRLNTFRQIERAFVKDLERPLPEDPILQIGQIFISAVLYGDLNHHSWANGFIFGLFNHLYQYGEMLWIDLWSEPLSASQQKNKSLYQRDPARYRRWFADPTSQMLIYRVLKLNRDFWNRSNTFNLEDVYSYYAAHIVKEIGYSLPKLKELFLIANSRTVLTHPPFMAAYTANQVKSASLPDPAWMRMLTGKSYPTATPPSGRPNKIDYMPATAGNVETQNTLLKGIRSLLTEAPLSRDKQSGLAERIGAFLNDNAKDASTIIQLLGEWAIQLLSVQQSSLERRSKKTPEAPSTVDNYLGTFAKELLSVDSFIDIFELDPDELHIFFKKVVYTIGELRLDGEKSHDELKINRIEYILNRLNQFLGYLEYFHETPHLSFEFQNNQIKIKCGEMVRANMMGVNEYHILLKQLGWGQKNLKRAEKMTLVAAILAYRIGLRVSEIHGLEIGDIQGSDRIELLVQPNYIRTLKSDFSKRRGLLYMFLTTEEIEFVRQWHAYRNSEIGSTLESPLFAAGPMEKAPYSKQELFNTLREKIKSVTGDPSMVPHSLRHSFSSILLLKLMIRNDIDNGDVGNFLKHHEFSLTSRERLKSLLLENEANGRKSLYAGATLLGHSDTDTQLRHYMHLCDWLTWHFNRHPSCFPPLTSKAIAEIATCSLSNAQKIKKSKAHFLLPKIRKNSRAFNELLAHPLLSQGRDKNIVKRPSNPLRKIAPYDEVLHQLYNNDQLPKGGRWPKSPIELWVLKHLYGRVESTENTTQHIKCAQTIQVGYRPYEKSIVIDDPIIWAQVLELLHILRIEFNVRHYASRWENKPQRREVPECWNQTEGIKIGRGQQNCGRNLEEGSMRIFITEIGFDEGSLRFCRKSANIFGLFLHCLTNQTRS